MTSTSISGGYSTGYSLTSSGQNPFTIGGSGSIGGNGVNGAMYAYGVGGYTWTITNYGVVNGTGVNGIQLGTGSTNSVGGSVTNQAGGSISGGAFGIAIFNSGAAYVVNYANATISGTNAGSGGGIYMLAAGTVTNSGVINTPTVATGVYGVLLKDGGLVTNNVNATIRSSVGVYSGTAASTVVNIGTITGVIGDGVQFGGSGSYVASGTVTNQTGGSISGGNYGIAVWNSGAASVVNDGNATISTTDSASGGGVFLYGPGTVTNYGVIATPVLATAGFGVIMENGGTVINHDTLSDIATIVGFNGVYIESRLGGESATLSNSGTIIGLGGDGVQLGSATEKVLSATVTNLTGGSIAGANFGLVVLDTNPSQIVNQTGATITGNNTAAGGGVYLFSPGTLTNYGVISGGTSNANSFGVHFEHGGDLINTVSSGAPTIEGYVGVYLGAYHVSTASTLVNDGVITGVGGDADGVQLGDPQYDTASGTITNQHAGRITGNVWGVQIYNAGASYVTNLSSGTIASTDVGGGGGVFLLNPGTITNSGVIKATTAQTGAYGVKLDNGGLVTNIGGATILGYVGVYIGQSGVTVHTSTVDNTGTITGTGNAIQLGKAGTSIHSGSVTNETGGSIAGGNYGIGILNIAASYVVNDSGATISGTNAAVGDAVYMLNPGTVTNQGVIQAATGRARESGVYLMNGGSIMNAAGATIQGNRGVYLGHAGGLAHASTVTNDGTIIAAGGDDAVYFGSGAPTSRLVVGTSAAFTGSIVGGGGVMELQTAVAPASIYGFGVTVSHFGTVAFDSANWTVGGNEAGLAAITAIDGFVQGDTIDVSDFAAVSSTFGGNELTLTAADTSQMTLHVVASNGTGFELGAYGPGGTSITECFAAGTRIATPDGETAVEDLAAGDLVLTCFAGITPVRWIGHRDVDCARHPDPAKVWPVRISAGAFGANQPGRDLVLSPNHAVFLNGVLIPVNHLINGASIMQVPVETVTYYHVELAEHDLLLAEGQPAESYLDVGDRWNFANGGDQIQFYPDFSSRPPDVAAFWEMHGCAPLLLSGPRLDAIRREVHDLANVVVPALAA